MPADDKNLLAYGDNLDVLRRYVRDESVDLVYLDPPFNSNADYNLLYSQQDGTRAAAQIKAFQDTWRWDQAAVAAYESVVEQNDDTSRVLQAFRTILGPSNMLAYLSMMAPRLIELRRVLKPSGSIYLHCDPTASHYLKLLMDAVFLPASFRNEIIWHYRRWTNAQTQFQKMHDVLLFYRAGTGTFNSVLVDPTASQAAVIDRGWNVNKVKDRDGKILQLLVYDREKADMAVGSGKLDLSRYDRIVYRDVAKSAASDTWTDIQYLHSQALERLGYPTQKPVALLERILAASTNPGDVVLDPFCGCGTAVIAAQRMGRRWIGIDVTHHATALIKNRLIEEHGPAVANTLYIIGEPTTVEDAKVLAGDDPFQFQAWSLGLVGARPLNGIKKGADHGIDGRLYFHESEGGVTREILLSVKAGHTGPAHVRDLRGVVEREHAVIGVLISLAGTTTSMRAEAANAGFYEFKGKKYPRLQLRTVAELLDGRGIDYPPTAETVFKPTIWPPESIPAVPRPRRRRKVASRPAAQVPMLPTRAPEPRPVGESPEARRLREEYERRAAALEESASQEAPQSREASKRDRSRQRP